MKLFLSRITFPIFCAVIFGIAIYAATPTENTPISAMPITTNVQEQAYFPLIQKYPGRSTNDNFRATISTLFHGRAGETVTNLAVTNIYVSNIFATTIITTNLFATNLLILNTNNYFTNLFVTNLYASTIYIDITNTYLTQTNFVINGTNVATVGDLLWTNIAGVLQPTVGDTVQVTNLFAFQNIFNEGSFIDQVGLTLALTNGANDLNPFRVGYMQLVGPTANPDDATIALTIGQGPGSNLKIENYLDNSGFSLTNNTPNWDLAGGHALLSQGDWKPTRRGETLFLWEDTHGDWVELGRATASTNAINTFDSLWHTNVGSASISPNLTGTGFYINTKGNIGIGPSTNIFHGKTFGAFYRVDLDGNDPMFVNTGIADTWPNPHEASEWWTKLTTNESVMVLTSLETPSGSGNAYNHEWVATVDGTFFYYLLSSNQVPTVRLDGMTGDITTMGVVNFGFDGTNSLLREGRNLVWTNDSASSGPSFILRNGNGVEASFKISQSTATVTGDNAVDLYEPTSGGILRWTFNRLWPLQPGAILGGEGDASTNPQTPFNKLNLDGIYYHYGFYDATGTNYSRLKLTHDGTNGNITLDSQSSGDAGVPRPFNFTSSDVRVGNVPEGLNLFVSQPPQTTDFYFTNVWVNGLTAGVNTVYTVPSGMRFLPLTTQVSANTNGTTCQAIFVSSSVPYRLASTSTVGTNGTTLATGSFVLEGGEDFAIDTTGPLYRAVVSGAVFTNTVPIFSPRLLSVSATTNLLYKVPAGKTAVEFNVTGSPIGAFYINSSGSAVDIKWYLVPGASAISTNQIYVRSNVADGAATSVSLLKFLKEGEAIVLESSSATATQVVYTTVLER